MLFLRMIRKDWEIYSLKLITLSIAFATAILVVSFFVNEFSSEDENVVRVLKRNETKAFEGRNRLSNDIPDKVYKHIPNAYRAEDLSVYTTLTTDRKTVEAELNYLFADSSFTYVLQPASEIYFGPRVVGENIRHGDIYCVTILGCISLLIIVLAATNFVNLVSLTLPARSKELAIRKVAGAHRSPLLGLMAKENASVVLISLLIGVGLFVAFPFPITVQFSITALILLGILVIAIIVAPLFPAWAFVKASPGRLLGTDAITFPRMKKVITVFQLGVSISLIIASLVIDRQISRSLIKEPGKNHDQVVYVPYPSQLTRESYYRLKLEWPRNNPHILELTAVSHTPDNLTSKNIGDDHFRMNVDYDFKDFFRLEMAGGRWFGPNDQDSTIVNEIGVDDFATNMGVIKNFGDAPVRITVGKDDYNFLMIRVLEVDIRSTVAVILRFFEEVSGRPIAISYFDKNYAAIIAYEDNLNKLSTLLAMVGVIMACCSIYALSLSRMNDNIKQIAIRKTFGASDAQIVRNLSWRFLELMLASVFFFGPITYWLLREWLRNFAYSAKFMWTDPLISIGICLAIVMIMNVFMLMRINTNSLKDLLRR